MFLPGLMLSKKKPILKGYIVYENMNTGAYHYWSKKL